MTLVIALIVQLGRHGKAEPIVGWAVVGVAAVLVIGSFALRAYRGRRRR